MPYHVPCIAPQLPALTEQTDWKHSAVHQAMSFSAAFFAVELCIQQVPAHQDSCFQLHCTPSNTLLSLSLLQNSKMRALAAYLLLVLGGNAAPSVEDVKGVLGSVSVEVEDADVQAVLDAVKDKVSHQTRGGQACLPSPFVAASAAAL